MSRKSYLRIGVFACLLAGSCRGAGSEAPDVGAGPFDVRGDVWDGGSGAIPRGDAATGRGGGRGGDAGRGDTGPRVDVVNVDGGSSEDVWHPTWERCCDLIDNDGDGDIDFNDMDCSVSPGCAVACPLFMDCVRETDPECASRCEVHREAHERSACMFGCVVASGDGRCESVGAEELEPQGRSDFEWAWRCVKEQCGPDTPGSQDVTRCVLAECSSQISLCNYWHYGLSCVEYGMSCWLCPQGVCTCGGLDSTEIKRAVAMKSCLQQCAAGDSSQVPGPFACSALDVVSCALTSDCRLDGSGSCGEVLTQLEDCLGGPAADCKVFGALPQGNMGQAQYIELIECLVAQCPAPSEPSCAVAALFGPCAEARAACALQ